MAFHDVPRTVDDPPFFLLWRLDDFAPPILMLSLGIVLEHLLLLTGLGLVLGVFYRRYRDGKPEMYALHAMYWAGIWPSRGRTMRNPFQRIYLP